MRRTLTGRLLVRYAATIVAVLAVLAVALDRTLASIFLDDLTRSLVAEARAVRVALRPEGESVQPAVASLGRELGLRITVIRSDGRVVADSAGDPAMFENHAGRPEVRDALAGRTGVASRVSESVGEPYRYVALPPEGGLIVRVALPLRRVDERLGDVRMIVLGVSAGAAAIGVLAVWLVAAGITRPLRRMTDSARRMAAGDLEARMPVPDPIELELLAETLNRLADDVAARIEEAGRDRRQLDRMLSALEEGILLVEPDGGVAYANPGARSLVGAPVEGAVRLGLPDLRAVVGRARHSGTPAQGELEAPGGRTVVAAALPLDEGDRVLVVLRDVTTARRVEAIRRDFVADASHELKTPVASIQAAAETVHGAVGEDPAAAARFAEQLRTDAIRLSRLVSDLLDLSRLETERPDPERVALDALVADEAAAIRPRAREAGLEVTVHTDPVSVAGSTDDLRLLLANLLDNAVRYTARGGRIDVGVGRSDGGALLSVADTGVGIPSRDLPRVFERFYRVDRARSRATGGTGLGLSIARHVAERHGGRIEAQSELGRGSTFRVWLPAVD